MKQKILLLSLGLCLITALSAQSHHEFSVGGGGGISSLQYAPAGGDQKIGMGGYVGLGYHFFFSPNWALKTGLDFGFYNAETTAGTLAGSYMAHTTTSETFTFTYDYRDYKEKQSAVMLTIPVMAQYQTAGHNAFYGALGVKIGIPLSANYKTSGTLQTSASFTDIGIGGITGLPDYNLDNYTVDQKSDLDLKVAILLSAEAGVKWALGERYSLYTGVYFDYGLNDINNGAQSELVGYPGKGQAGGLTYGSLAANSDKINLLAAGVTVRLSFGAKKAAAKE